MCDVLMEDARAVGDMSDSTIAQQAIRFQREKKLVYHPRTRSSLDGRSTWQHMSFTQELSAINSKQKRGRLSKSGEHYKIIEDVLFLTFFCYSCCFDTPLQFERLAWLVVTLSRYLTFGPHAQNISKKAAARR